MPVRKWTSPKHNVLIIDGDMIVQIRKDKSNKFYLNNSSNRNEEHIIDFSLENRLTCLNIKFQKTEGNYEPTPTQIMLKHRGTLTYKQEMD